jgi:hypothetical protein
MESAPANTDLEIYFTGFKSQPKLTGKRAEAMAI